MRQTRQLRNFLSLRFAVVAILPVFIIAALAFILLIPMVVSNINIQHESAAVGIANQMSILLGGGEQQLSSLARYIDGKMHRPYFQIESLLDAQCGQGELFETIYLASRQSRRIVHVGLAQKIRYQREDLIGLDLSGHHILADCWDTQKTAWSDLFLSTVSSRMTVALTLPLKENVLIGEITLGRLSEFVSQLPGENRFTAMVLDRTGRILADSRRLNWGQHLDLSALSRKADGRWESFPLARFELNGRTMLGSLVQAAPASLDWYVLVVQQATAAYKPLTTMLLLLASGLGSALVLALGVAWRQAKDITGRINVFIGYARSIARGQYDMEIPVSKTTELTVLGDQLKIMAGIIRDREAELKANESYLAITMDSIGDGVIATDISGRVTRMNPMARKLTGLDGETVMGQYLWKILTALDPATRQVLNVEQMMQKNGLAGFNCLCLLVSATGDEYLTSQNGAPIRREDHTIVGGVLVFRDVSQIHAKDQQIRENESLLKSITENIPEAVLQAELDHSGVLCMRYISPRAEQIFNIPARPASFLNDFIRCLPEPDRGRFQDSLKTASEGNSWAYEGEFIRPSGQRIWFEGSAHVSKTSENIVFNGMLSDQTRRHDMEESLKVTQFSFEHAAIGIFMTDSKGKIIRVNTKGAEQIGYTVETLTGMNIVDIDADLDREAWKTMWQDLREDQERYLERYHLTKDGGALPVHIKTNRMAYGGHLFSISFVIDVTKQKQARQELARLHGYLSSVINSMPSVLIGLDQNLVVTQWNKAVAAVTGIPVKDALGADLETVFPRLGAQAGKIRNSLKTKTIERSMKSEYKGKNHEIRYEDIMIFPLTHAGSQDAVVRIDDITEKVRLEEMLIQNEKMLSVGGLAAGMAHEINNPLAGMTQNAALLANRLTRTDIPANIESARRAGITMEALAEFMADRQVPRILSAITGSGRRIAGIVDNMLSFSRKSEAVFSGHDPAQLMDKTLALAKTDYDLKKKYDFKGIEIKKEYEAGLPMISCEGSKIQQVLLNIFNNGAYAMFERADAPGIAPPQFILRLSWDREQGMVRFEIQDNGIGMDEGISKKIFEPFFTTKPVGLGTGLGLSVSYFIVTENHGGRMEVVSAPGKGANFIICLPVTNRAGKTAFP